jgi:hypothetical protein
MAALMPLSPHGVANIAEADGQAPLQGGGTTLCDSSDRDDSQVLGPGGQATQVVGVTGRDHRGAKFERRRDNERIDRVCRAETCASEERARPARCARRQVHHHDPAPVESSADQGITRSATTHFGEDRRGDANERLLLMRHLENCPGALRKRAALTSSRQRVERLGVED